MITDIDHFNYNGLQPQDIFILKLYYKRLFGIAPAPPLGAEVQPNSFSPGAGWSALTK